MLIVDCNVSGTETHSFITFALGHLPLICHSDMPNKTNRTHRVQASITGCSQAQGVDTDQ
jgi:hypothetical protein